MHRRINITLPEQTVQLIDRVAEKGDRSRLIDKAVKRYVTDSRRANLKKRLRRRSIAPGRARSSPRRGIILSLKNNNGTETHAELSEARRGISLVNFDPVVGAEIRKTRPALVLQNDIANRHSPLTIVCAIISQYDEPLYPTEVFLRAGEGGTTIDSVALLNQIRSVDKRRLVRRLGLIRRETMHSVDRALQISLGLVAI